MKAIVLKNTILAATMATAFTASMQTAAAQMEETLVEGSLVPVSAVKYSRSDLATTEGRARIERQIRLAASLVCGTQKNQFTDSLTPSAVARNKSCYKRSVEEAMLQLGNEAIASID